MTVVAGSFWCGTCSAQEHLATYPSDTVEINRVQDIFTKGTIHGHVRNYFMATINHRHLTDNYANAIGARVAYNTAQFHGFRVGYAGLFTFNLFSSDMTARDPVTGKYPSLELELFDIEDPGNKANLDRLDELYLEYKTNWLHAKAGRFSFVSPLMNPQDTRMMPYSFQGVSLQFPLKDKALLTLAWFDHFSPRSTIEWYSTAESIGIYSAGVDTKGNPSAYPQHISTNGVAVTSLEVKTVAGKLPVQAELWNYWIENVSNTSYSRAVVEIVANVKVGVEGIYQTQVGNGGNPEAAKAYFPDQRQWLVGGRLAYEPESWDLSLNYLHVGGDGRFLFPKEWGREQFFATISRGRVEGTGKSDLAVAKVTRNWTERFSTEVAVARAWMPDLDNYTNNKYGAVSYTGWMIDTNYSPSKPVLKGLSIRLLYVGKASSDSTIPLGAMYYTTNFHNINLITQFSF